MKYRATSSVAKASASVWAAALYSDVFTTRTTGDGDLEGAELEALELAVEWEGVELVADSMVIAALIFSMLGRGVLVFLLIR